MTRQRKNNLTLADVQMWRTHSCVARRHSCRRPLHQGVLASSGDSTRHAGVRAPRQQRRSVFCPAVISLLLLTSLAISAFSQTADLAPVVSKLLSRTADVPGEFQPFLVVSLHARVTGRRSWSTGEASSNRGNSLPS